MDILYGMSNFVSLCAAAALVCAALLAMRHVGGGGALILMIGAFGQLIVSLFWAATTIGNLVGISLFDRFGPGVFGGMSVLSSGIFLMEAVGMVFVLLKVAAILRHHAVVEGIRADQAGAGRG